LAERKRAGRSSRLSIFSYPGYCGDIWRHANARAKATDSGMPAATPRGKPMSDIKEKELSGAIRRAATGVVCPDGSTLRTIDLANEREIAHRGSVSRREVQIAALSAGIVPRRYLRNIGTLGIDGQIKLLRAKVAVVGIGGLGGTIAKNLARVGVGALVLIDGDVFSEDNLNRQEFCSEEVIDRSKVAVAAAEIAKLNGAVEVTAVEKKVDADDLIAILPGCAAAVDALDSIPSRFALSDAAASVGVPLVHGSVAGFAGQVAVLRPAAGGFSAIFGDREALPEKGVEVFLGNLPGVVGTVANLQTVEVIKILTNKGEPIDGRLLFMDLEAVIFDLFDI
jgi:molybdopterin-synthase adenylyltransferase